MWCKVIFLYLCFPSPKDAQDGKTDETTGKDSQAVVFSDSHTLSKGYKEKVDAYIQAEDSPDSVSLKKQTDY